MRITCSASIMSGDLVNLETTIRQLEELRIDALHVDVLDGVFSPSMPLGLETIKRIREVTELPLEAHLMTMDNEFFIGEMVSIGMDSITFHYETSLHVDRYINLIKASGAKAGIALNPATPLSVLEFVLPQVDRVCAMLINPGYATHQSEQQVPYATRKVRALRDLIDAQNLEVDLQVDGRVSLDSIPGLIGAGARNLVLGSTGLFLKGRTLREGRQLLDAAVASAQYAEVGS
ncbi:MAG: ribulose-phosphate 3-epimerase [Propionicimonas sp.]